MRKVKYKKTICIPVSEEMFSKIKEITDEKEITYSKFIREAITKLMEEKDD